MSRKIFCAVSVCLLSTVLSSGYVQAQTPGHIPLFDQPGTGYCNLANGSDCIDSVISQDPSGNVGIGTDGPVGAFDVSRNFADAIFSLSSIGAQRWQLNSSASGRLDIRRQGGGGISITPSEDVGIGTTAPVFSKFHVTALGSAVRGSSTGDSPGVGVRGESVNGPGVSGETQSFFFPGVRAISYQSSSANLGLQVLGRFTATGTKNAIVPLDDGQQVLLNAEESTEVWFSDYGSAQLVNGLTVVQIDPEFLQTVDVTKDYHVFLTARGNPIGSVYVDNETPSSFEIRETTGTANTKVSYRIVAKRKDFADERLKRAEWVQHPELSAKVKAAKQK